MSLTTTSTAPAYCLPEAYDLFTKHLPNLWTTEGLLGAAIAVNMHAFSDIVPDDIVARLQGYSRRVRALSRSDQPSDVREALHRVLFDDAGFEGDTETYYSALNSYLSTVLSSRRGLPITLSLIYKVVGEWSGLTVAGINARGHFLTRVRLENGWQIVDPFFKGELLTREQAYDRLDEMAQRPLPRTEDALASPTHAQWIFRLIGNLRQLFLSEGRRHDLAAMTELQEALKQAELL
jgi:regulator of sirC expression with transglutaminase-like and TPR domain